MNNPAMEEMNAPETVLVFRDDGYGVCLYNETIPLLQLGCLCVKRLSYVEFDRISQAWQVRTKGGEAIFSHPSRTVCLNWENHWFVHEILLKE